MHVAPGIEIFRGHKALVLQLHYTSDPGAEKRAREARHRISPAEFEREYEINWNVGGGSYVFRKILEQHGKKIIVDPIDRIPEEWTVWYGYDYGWFPSYTAIVELAFNEEESCYYVTWEFYAQMQVTSQVADQFLMRPRFGVKPFLGVFADPSTFNVSNPMVEQKRFPRGISEGFAQYGVMMQKARTSPTEGLMHIMELWSQIETIGPRLKICANCDNLINELLMLRYDERKPNAIAPGIPDHAYDALRYGLWGGKRLTEIRPVEEPEIHITATDINSVIFWYEEMARRREIREIENTRKIRSVRDLIREKRRRVSQWDSKDWLKST